MWGPLKDTGKEGFSVRRQAEKQQPVYRLILLCAPNFVAASCEAPPLSFSSVSAQPHRPPLPNPVLCFTFLAAASCMGAFLEQKQICLVRRHFLSLDLCLSLSCLKAEQWGYSEKKNVLALRFMFCNAALRLTCFVSPVPFLSGKLSI